MRLIILFCLSAFVCGCRVSVNLHEVDPGKLYRSAQLEKDEFAKVFEVLGVKTVVNLRGKDLNRPEYIDEVEVTNQYGVDLIDIDMSASSIPHKKNVVKLLETFETAKYPMLIHCQGGADRTGEASAMYQMIYMGKTKDEALKQLTVKYLHFEKRYPAKRYFIHLFQGVEWVLNEYDPCTGTYQYYDVNNPYCNGTDTDAVPDLGGDT